MRARERGLRASRHMDAKKLLQEAKLIRSVVKNMIKKDNKLVAVDDATDVDGDPILIVHPNIPHE